jgi:hypothetical protein
MSNQWYWQHHQDSLGPLTTEELGPLTTEELEELIRQGRIANTDQIRAENDEEWQTAEIVKAIFASDPAASPQTPAQVASQLLAQGRNFQGQRTATRSACSTFGVIRFFSEWTSGLPEWAGQGTVIICSYWPRLAGRWVTLAVFLATLGSLFIRGIDFDSGENRRIYQEFALTIQLIKTQRDSKAGNAEWRPLRETLIPKLASAKNKMEESYARYGHGRQRTLDFEIENFTARAALIQTSHHLVQILNAGKTFKPETLALAELEMQKVEQVFSGAFISDHHAKWSMQPSQNAQSQRHWLLAVDSLTLVFIAVDTLLVVGAIGYFWRRQLAGV